MENLGEFDFWRFLAGLGIFLVGMYFMELALKNLASRSFKKFLRHQTTNPLKGIAAGALVTSFLQSSSIVSLMVLAFVGAGILKLRNAIGIVFGSNLGTTFTGWIVAWFGFRIDIEGFSLPLIAIGAVVFIFFNKFERLFETGRAILGFGLLFLGLQYMKGGIETWAAGIDIGTFSELSPFLFFPLGMAISAIIQSSSGAIVIGLAALNSGIISMASAGAFVIGINLGTTVTAVLGSINGIPAKKRVAASHILFNVAASAIALPLLYPLLYFIQDILAVKDDIIAMVLFHTIFNLLGVILISPFIGILAKFLEGRFAEATDHGSEHIDKVPVDVPEAAIEALRLDIHSLVEYVMYLNVLGLNIRTVISSLTGSYQKDKKQSRTFNHADDYASLKELEGKTIEYYVDIQNEKLESEESSILNRYIQSIRNGMVSAKEIKDLIHNIREFENSSNDAKRGLYLLLKGKLVDFYLELFREFKSTKKEAHFEKLVDMLLENRRNFEWFLKEIYAQVEKKSINEAEISSLLHVNRGIHDSNRALILAMKDLLLSPEEADNFTNIPETKYF